MVARHRDAETRYANIEHELLGVVGGLEKLNYFTFGRPVTVLTNHKPFHCNFKEITSECPTQASAFIVKISKLQCGTPMDPW